MKEIKNAIIKSTMLGTEDHGVFSCMLHLEYGHSGQGFGGYTLDEYSKEKKDRIGTAYGLQFIKEILKVLEVNTWEKLRGVYCRAEMDNTKVYRIWHLLKDQWFDPSEFSATYKV